MLTSNKLSNNALTVMALSSEYCRALELAGSTEPREFVGKMVKLLPRIYMAVTDLPKTPFEEPEYMFGATHLDETYYDQVCQNVATLLGAADSYLDTFQQDMKYSETPIAATISEGLSDIFQVLYNFVEDVRNADPDDVNEHLAGLRGDFDEYWSQTLCNVMRPLNEIATGHTALGDESEDMDFV